MGLIKINNLECLSPFELSRVIEDAKARLYAKTSEQKKFWHEERVREMENYRRVLEKVIAKRFGCTLATFNSMSRAAAVKGKPGRPKTKVKNVAGGYAVAVKG